MHENDDLYRLAEQVGILLQNHGAKLVAAESCTGGWVCQTVTEIAGSSAWFDRGFITYSNSAKQELLGVPESILADYGAVSEETVLAMTAGALNHSLADFAVAVSGIAGPTGATPDKPVGTVWFAWERRDGDAVTLKKQFDGDRHSVRKQAVAKALEGFLIIYG